MMVSFTLSWAWHYLWLFCAYITVFVLPLLWFFCLHVSVSWWLHHFYCNWIIYMYTHHDGCTTCDCPVYICLYYDCCFSCIVIIPFTCICVMIHYLQHVDFIYMFYDGKLYNWWFHLCAYWRLCNFYYDDFIYMHFLSLWLQEPFWSPRRMCSLTVPVLYN